MSDNKNNNEHNSTIRRGKVNGYNSAHLHAKRDRKRREAEARQREHDVLTINEKIEKAQSRIAEGKGSSFRELKRLKKQAELAGVELNSNPKKAVKPVKPVKVKK